MKDKEECPYCLDSHDWNVTGCDAMIDNFLPTSEVYDDECIWEYLSCSREEGHSGPHIACCARMHMHEIAQWED